MTVGLKGVWNRRKAVHQARRARRRQRCQHHVYGAVCWRLSDAAKFVTGQTIAVESSTVMN